MFCEWSHIFSCKEAVWFLEAYMNKTFFQVNIEKKKVNKIIFCVVGCNILFLYKISY